MNDFFKRNSRLAIVGLSRNPKSFSRQAYDFLKSQGFELYPVNPQTEIIDGEKSYDSIGSLPEMEAAVFFTSPRVTESLLADCKSKGIHNLWFQQGSVDEAAMHKAHELGLNCHKSCVFLQFPNAGFPHNLHRWVVRIMGKDQ